MKTTIAAAKTLSFRPVRIVMLNAGSQNTGKNSGRTTVLTTCF
jgi:hypothetical protein